MAKYEDYVKKANEEKGGIQQEIDNAQNNQAQREEQATAPSTTEVVDWEARYKELEKHNSKQAQDLGTYRQLVDNYIANPTPTPQPTSAEPSQPITVDDLYDNPDEAVRKAVESHPAIKRVEQLEADVQKREKEAELMKFLERHPDAQTVGQDPEFATWVQADPMRLDMYARGNQFDLVSADALLTMFKSHKQLDTITNKQANEQAVNNASLEDSANTIAPTEPPKYSRSEFVQKKIRAQQGDLEAEAWVQANVAGYREALQANNVRD